MLALGSRRIIRGTKEVSHMANQIQSCFERYEKKYMLTPAQLRVMLTA